MDAAKNAGIQTPQSDSDWEVDIMTYSDNDEDFQTMVWGRDPNAGEKQDAQLGMVNVMSCELETYHGTSSTPGEQQVGSCGVETSCRGDSSVPGQKQESEAESCYVDLLRGNGDAGLLGGDLIEEQDAELLGNNPLEEQDFRGAADNSAGTEDMSLGDGPIEKQDVADGDDTFLGSCFDTKVSENESEWAASEWSPMSDDSDSKGASRDDFSRNSDVSEELHVERTSSENEDGHEYDHTYGREDESPRDSVTGEGGISKDVKILSHKAITFNKITPFLYKATFGGKLIVYTESRVTDCKVVLKRLPAVVENCYVDSRGHGGLGEHFSAGNRSNCNQVELTNGAQSALSVDVNSGSDFDNLSSVSSSSKSKSSSVITRIIPEYDPTYCPRRSTTTKDVDGYFENRNGRFVCKMCGAEFVKSGKLRPHINEHTGKYKCKKCGKVFAHKKGYKAHVLKHPNDSRFSIFCEICGKGFSQTSNRNTHMKLVHSHERNFVCNICGARWKRPYDLRDHIRRVHEGIKPKASKPLMGKKRYPCPVCGGMFTELSSHMRKHTGEKPYQCNICERRFSHRNAMVMHQRTHTGERPYKCTQCDKTFTQSSHRQSHMQAVHCEEYNYKCETCGKAFKSSSYLKVHNESHANAFAFICKICGVGCHTKRLLKSHMLIHEVEKRFECTDCGLKFRHPSAYQSHMKVHRQEWTHKYAICGAGFVRKDTYLNHMKRH